ncbi:MAG: low temperature requirement protein A [Streptosporangiales bacterium]|nr:low temperature requirement protein A [Streptosporangiales bacterium]
MGIVAEPVTTAEKRVTFAELFFDLVFVFAITQVSALLHEDHSWAGVGRALVLFVPIYWAWVGTTIHANTHDIDNPLDRLGVFALALCGLFMALAVPAAYEERGLLFGAAYFAVRIVLAALVFRGPRIVLNPFGVALCVTGPLLLAGGFLDGTARLALWVTAAFVDLATPRLTRRRLTHIHFDSAHMPERFGLFVIIALGESIVATGVPASSAARLDAGVVATVAAAFVLACALWWVYFHFAASAIRHGLTIASVQTDIVRHVLSYGHLGFIGAIIAVAVGLAEAVAHPADPLGAAVASLLFGGCALYLATFGYTRWRMFRQLSTTRFGAAAVVLALLPVALYIPALAALSVLGAAVVSLNVLEYVRVKRRTGG